MNLRRYLAATITLAHYRKFFSRKARVSVRPGRPLSFAIRERALSKDGKRSRRPSLHPVCPPKALA